MEVTGKQIGQLTADVAELKAEKGKLPSQTVPNPKCGVNAITLLSGQLLEDLEAEPKHQKLGASSEDHAAGLLFPYADLKEILKNHKRSAYRKSAESAYCQTADPIPDLSDPPLPFPTQLKKLKNNTELDQDLLELFRKVELSIPLIDAIQQIPKYAKFLKDLCTKRRGELKVDPVPLKRNVAAVLNREVNPKCEDQGMFTIPCIIGDARMNNCMLDIASAINVIPYSLYRTMQLDPLQSTNSIVQLANKSCVRPEGIIVDVLVRVEELVLFADFYVLKDDVETSNDDLRIILGRPFMVTTRTKTDSWTGEVTMEANGRKVMLNGYNYLHEPPDIARTHEVGVDKNATWEPDATRGYFSHEGGEEVELLKEIKPTWTERDELNVIKVYATAKSCSSLMQVPKFEWKSLRKHLDYSVQDEEEKLSPFGKKGPDKGRELAAPTIKH